MSVKSKPHQSEPLAVIEDDGLGGKVIRPTDVWYNYFAAVDQEINTTLVQNITSVSYSQSNGQMADRALIHRNDVVIGKVEALLAQLNVKAGIDNTRHEASLHGLKSEIAQILTISAMKNEAQNSVIKSLQAQVAQLLATVDKCSQYDKKLESMQAQIAQLVLQVNKKDIVI